MPNPNPNPNPIRIATHTNQDTQNVATFVGNLSAASQGSRGVFDSVAADAFVSESINRSGGGMPQELGILFDEVGNSTLNLGGREVPARELIAKSILDGVDAYTAEHGEAPSADMLRAAIYQGYSTTEEARSKAVKFDAVSADTNHSDPSSMQPNRAVVAIMGTIAEGIPIANYLPYDIGSNEARLIIVQHVAGNTVGQFKAGDILDGLQGGNAFLSTARTIKLDAQGKGKFTSAMLDAETADPAGSPVSLLRGRTIIYVQGMPVGTEAGVTAAALSQLTGTLRMGSTDYALSGTVTPDTGDVAVSFNPALPANTAVHAEGFIDLEKSDVLTPLVNVQALKFSLFANAWRALTEVTIDSATQFSHEVGLSPETETVLAIRNQFANERHYDVVRKAARLGAWNTGTYQFNWSIFGQQKTRSQIAQDILAALYPLEQRMANLTMDHGITHLYVDEIMASTLLCCDSTVFTPSGVNARPTIYRLGRLLNKYEVYVNPQARNAASSPDVSQIICVGRSTQAGRNPFVLGDAVAPMAVPVATGRNFKRNAGFYARNFTAVNPHDASAKGCAILTVTGIGNAV